MFGSHPIRILVVDDDLHTLVALEGALAALECNLVKASSGRDALDLAVTQDFAVIVLDIHMPHLDGLETAARLRAHPRTHSTPIIFMTADDRTGAQVLDGYRLGAVDYLYKPFHPAILRAKVAIFVELSRKSLALEQRTAELTSVANELDRSKEHFRVLIEDAADLTLILEDTGVIRYTSPSIERILGYLPEKVVGQRMVDLVHPDDVVAFDADLALLRDTDATSLPTGRRWRHIDGSYRVVEANGTNLLTTPSVAGLVIHARDVTARNRAEDQVRALHLELERTHAAADLRDQSLHDGLTGLPNRRLLNAGLEQALGGVGGGSGQCALLLVDLDRFKEVNDALGHQVGDDLLQQVGHRLQEAAMTSNLVARLGGDEFAVLLANTDVGHAAQVADDLIRVLQLPFLLAGRSIAMDASIGIAVAPQHGQDPDTLLRRADAAIEEAKRRGLGVAVYGRAGDEPRPDRLALLGELRHAVEHDELRLHYQPKLNLRDGQLVGLEALLRWQHPRRGLLPPVEFIPLAEQSGLIYPLTEWVLEAALRQQQAWIKSGINTPLAVNLSRRTVQNQRLPDRVAELLNRWDVPASGLVLEITESGLMGDPLRAGANLKRVRALGVGISIDDFGTGYSSLASLQELSVDELKIDQSFVQAMSADVNARAIVRAIIDLGDALDLRVVAEGVEDRGTWDVLVGLGCDVAQGYFVSPPLAAPELEAWLAEVGPTWLELAESPRDRDTLQERIDRRGARLAAEDEFIARRRAEVALHASEELNRLALQAAGMGTWEWDPIHDVYIWSAETQALHGLKPGTFEGSFAALRRAVHADDWPDFDVELQAYQAEHRDSFATYRAVWPDGSVRWLESRGRATYAADGALQRVTGTSLDITQRKLAEEALRASEERFRKQYKGFPLPTYSWLQVGDDFVLQDYNDAAEAYSGANIKNRVGQRASERHTQHPLMLDNLRTCVATQRTIRRETRYRYPDTGQDRVMAMSFVFVPPQTVMVHTEDVTDARHAEQQREAMAQSEKLRALGQMASGIAHDLNQSLMLAASYTDLARAALSEDPPNLAELDDHLTTATRSVLDGGETVKRLLLFARSAPNQDSTPVDLNTIVREAAQLTAPRWRDAAQAEGRPISLFVETEGQPTVQGSPGALRELLTNLIFNAVDALPTGGTIRLRVRAEAGQGIIEVIDSGVGMSTEVQQRVFEPFYTTKGESGTGLGLAMVFGIVEQHGGHIEVRSAPGAGTTFHITFPLVDQPKTDADSPPPTPVGSARPLRILIVDDEPMMTRAVVRMLKPAGHLVSVAASGEEALTKLSEQPVDVVVSDMGMGAGMNGWELAEAVKQRWPGVRFLLATGWGAAIDPGEARAKGVEAVLAKPFQLPDLLRALAPDGAGPHA